MSDEKAESFETEQIREVLEELGITAERALEVLVRSLVNRHLIHQMQGCRDVLITHDGKAEYTGGDSLFAVITTLTRDAEDTEGTFLPGTRANVEAADPALDTPQWANTRSTLAYADIQQALAGLLCECMAEADEQDALEDAEMDAADAEREAAAQARTAEPARAARKIGPLPPMRLAE